VSTRPAVRILAAHSPAPGLLREVGTSSEQSAPRPEHASRAIWAGRAARSRAAASTDRGWASNSGSPSLAPGFHGRLEKPQGQRREQDETPTRARRATSHDSWRSLRGRQLAVHTTRAPRSPSPCSAALLHRQSICPPSRSTSKRGRSSEGRGSICGSRSRASTSRSARPPDRSWIALDRDPVRTRGSGLKTRRSRVFVPRVSWAHRLLMLSFARAAQDWVLAEGGRA